MKLLWDVFAWAAIVSLLTVMFICVVLSVCLHTLMWPFRQGILALNKVSTKMGYWLRKGYNV